MRIIVDGKDFNIFSIDEKKISEFKNFLRSLASGGTQEGKLL